MANRRRYRVRPQTLGAVVQAYRNSPEFDQLADNTKRAYLRALGYIQDYGRQGAQRTLYEAKMADIRRRHVIAVRDYHRQTPGVANQIVNMFSVLFKYAIHLEYVDINPARDVGKLRIGEHERWPQEALDYAMSNLPDRFSRAITLAVYTGQRQGDLLRMAWTDYDGEGIEVVQQKTKARLWIPCHSDLRTALEDWRQGRTATTILTSSAGRPWGTANVFSSRFSHALADHPQLHGLTFHGLRKTAAAMLAECGCSTHEIAAITGHKTLQMLQHYTAQAEQRTRAKAAIIKLETNRLSTKAKSLK